MQKLTKGQAIVIMGYTGVTTCNFSDFHADVEKRLNRPVWTHEFASREFAEKLRQVYYEDFIKMCSN